MKKRLSGVQQKFYDRQFSRVEIKPFPVRLNQNDMLYFAGSCFAENLYSFWQDHFLPSVLSPFGSSYNPVSVKEGFTALCDKRQIQKDELFYQGGLWHHSLFNTTVSRADQDELLRILNQEIKRHRDLLKESSFLILTLGTAFVYQEKKSKKVVNNCHKRPGSDFIRYPLEPKDVSQALTELNKTVRTLNPSVKIILSLSPVRHLRDDASENSLSKAILRCGIDNYLKSCPENEAGSFYFPSYEILLDELRDYRWYADDLCHPSPGAVNYIMERFCEGAADKELQHYLTEAESLKNMIDHKFRFPGSPDALAFTEKKEKVLREFQKKYPLALLHSASENATLI